MPQRLGIIGHPIGHSISPAFQQAALDAIGFNAVYRPFDVPSNEVADFVNALRTPETLGVNVTVPHKEAVIPHLDEVDDWAAAAGAVNTIVNRHGRLTGHNTDGTGFLRALQDGAGFAPQKQNRPDPGRRRFRPRRSLRPNPRRRRPANHRQPHPPTRPKPGPNRRRKRHLRPSDPPNRCPPSRRRRRPDRQLHQLGNAPRPR